MPPEAMNVPYITVGPPTPWDALVENAYANMVDYLLRDHTQWVNWHGTHPVAKLSRPQRLRRKLRNAWFDARFAVGHWIAGPCPESEW